MDFEFYYNEDIIGFVGRKTTGKTYLTKSLLKLVPKEKVYILDSREQYTDYPNRTVPKLNETNVTALNSFIDSMYSHTDCLAVFDDLDLYIKYPNESEKLANFFIDAGSKSKIGGIWHSKRLAYIDTRAITESKYLVIGRGLNPHDQKKLLDLGFDLKKYQRDVVGSWAVAPYAYALFNTQTQETKLIKGF